MPSGLYPGIGQPLYRCNDSFAREPRWIAHSTPDPVIPTTKASVPWAVNGGRNVEINVVYDSAPTTSAFEIYYAPGIDQLADAYVIDTIPATTDTFYSWSSADDVKLSGLMWIKNIGTADINEAYIQGEARTVG